MQTLDFFTPIVDDPFLFGSIAAANSVSDVYAMGGRPVTAMAITCFPEKSMDLSVLREIMEGGLEKLQEAGVALMGGHTVTDDEIKFGYSVTGLVHPDRILTNAGARPGDVLILTKPLGIGILASGIKFKMTSRESAKLVTDLMTTLNRNAADVLSNYPCHALTDVTGNGLLGHAMEMAQGSQVSIRIRSLDVPYIPEAYTLAKKTRILPRTIHTTWDLIRPRTKVHASVPDPLRRILLDPQTSGGLLISLDSKHLEGILDSMAKAGVQASCIGEVSRGEAGLIVD